MADAYIRLITGSAAATGMASEFASRYMAEHLTRLAAVGGEHAQGYADAARCLTFCTGLEADLMNARRAAGSGLISEGLGKWRSERTMKKAAKKLLQRLATGEATLVPVTYARLLRGDGHITYVLARPERDAAGVPLGTLELALFNSGGALDDAQWEKYHMRSPVNGKWQTVATFGGVRLGDGQGELNVASLVKMFRLSVSYDGAFIDNDLPLYKWLEALGKLRPDPSLPGHAKQKVGSCTHKGLMSYLAYTLPTPAFLRAKAILLADAVQQLSERTDPIDSLALPALALVKATRAQAKLHGAATPRLVVRRANAPEENGARPHANSESVPVIGDEPEHIASAQGSASMRAGFENIDIIRFNPTRAVYFPGVDGKYYFVVLGDEPDLARNLWRGVRPQEAFQRLYLRVPQQPGQAGTVGFHIHDGGPGVNTGGQSACVRTSVRAKLLESATERRLVAKFQGAPGIRSGSGTQNNRFKGEFKAELLDMRNRQLVRPGIESLCRAHAKM